TAALRSLANQRQAGVTRRGGQGEEEQRERDRARDCSHPDTAPSCDRVGGPEIRVVSERGGQLCHDRSFLGCVRRPSKAAAEPFVRRNPIRARQGTRDFCPRRGWWGAERRRTRTMGETGRTMIAGWWRPRWRTDGAWRT